MSLDQLETIINYLHDRGLISGTVCMDLISALASKHAGFGQKDLLPVCFSGYLRSALKKYQDIQETDMDYRSISADIKKLEKTGLDNECGLETFQKILREHRHGIFSRIALNILTGRMDFREVAEVQTLAAEVLIKKAFGYCSSVILKKYGLVLRDILVVFGMGKLGASELNFSSDVDLVAFCVSDDVKQAAEEAARLMLRVLSDNTEDGFVLRVDYELRPGGQSAPLVSNIAEAFSYYEGWGHTWERLAWLKARYICGSPDMAEKFLKELKPFVFRKFLDYSTIEEVRSIKKLMKYQAGSRLAEYNLKMGEGGIRELEFCAVSLLLIYSGRFAELQEYSLDFLRIMDRLQKFRVLPKPDITTLKDNYVYLRDMEHILQCFDDRQTYNVDKKQMERILFVKHGKEFIGNESAMVEKFYKRAEWNRKYFNGLFTDDVVSPEEQQREKLLLFGGSNPDRIKALSVTGFEKPEEAALNIDAINDILNYKYFSVNIREKGFLVVELFLSRIMNASGPDKMLLTLKRFLNAIKSRPTLFLLLYENKDLIDLFAKLFEGGLYFAEMFIHHPEFIDTMIMGGEMVTQKGKGGIRQSYGLFCSGAGSDVEAKMESMKLFKVYEESRIGLSYLSSLIDVSGVNAELSFLADIIVRESMEGIGGDWQGMAVMGLGRLGERAVNFGSDLDLIFVYDETMHSPEAVTRKMQRLVTLLSSQSRYGKLYSIDMDLRPSGHSGPLAAGFGTFVKYHNEHNNAWEKIAFWKTRFIGGDLHLGRRIIKFKNSHIKGIRPDKEFLQSLADVRKKVLDENAAKTGIFNIKYGSGALLDIEYVTRIMQLFHKRVSCGSLSSALSIMSRKGYRDAEVLYGALMFYRRMETAVRINSGTDQNAESEMLPVRGTVENIVNKYLKYGTEK
ncbi:MAG: hypothetical protein JXA66_04910 [Oligoflexia bacterium]|nr:hypothetical protein [Oligoflexia bacterium]